MGSEIAQAIVLDIVQGITEFFPVSSTAHLILFPWFFRWSGEVNTLAFDVALHAGTLCALLLCFYRDWIHMISKDRKMLFFIFYAEKTPSDAEKGGDESARLSGDTMLTTIGSSLYNYLYDTIWIKVVILSMPFSSTWLCA